MFYCSECKSSFVDSKLLINHLRFYHNKTPYDRYDCITCNRIFSSLNTYKKHVSNRCPEQKLVSADPSCESLGNDSTEFDLSFENCLKGNVSSEFGLSFENALDENVSSELNSNPLSPSHELNLGRDEDSNSDCDWNDSCNAFIQLLFPLVSNLYSKFNIPRKVVIGIVCDLKRIFNTFGDIIIKKLKILSFSKVNEFKNFFTFIHKIFSTFDTEYNYKKQINKYRSLPKPEKIVVGSRLDTLNDSPVIKPCTYVFISIKDTLKSFFSDGKVFNETIQNLEKLNGSNFLESVVHGEVWKLRTGNDESENSYNIPLHIYCDDFEAGNPLGSHSGINKIGAVYFNVPVIPDKYLSCKNIFPCLFYYASDLKKFGTEIIFSQLINELKFLEENYILYDQNSINYKLKFICLNFLGDNLAMNSILGFSESFSAKYYCRNCRQSKEICEVSVNSENLRTKQNYEIDLKSNSKTAIKNECVFNKLSGYHVAENLTADLMHDLLEGVCLTDLRFILKEFILTEKLFSLDTLNSYIKFFPFDNSRPPLISLQFLSTEKIKLSASEALHLSHALPLMIGNLIPENNMFWKLYLYLRKILKIVLSKKLRKDHINILSSLIAEHNKLYLSLKKTKNTKAYLKPKNHFLVHYPEILSKMGPLIYMSCMRFESKHKEAKSISNSISSKVNLPYSIAVKEQFFFSNLIFTKEFFTEQLMIPKKKTEVTISNEIFSNGKIYSVDWIFYFNNKYKKNKIVCTSISNDNPHFASVQDIYINNTKIIFLLTKTNNLGFNEHFFSYNLELTNETFYIELNQLKSDFCENLTVINNTKYFSPKFEFIEN